MDLTTAVNSLGSDYVNKVSDLLTNKTEGKRTEELHTKIIFHHMRKLLSGQIYGILQ